MLPLRELISQPTLVPCLCQSMAPHSSPEHGQMEALPTAALGDKEEIIHAASKHVGIYHASTVFESSFQVLVCIQK